jgi:hypothetical protein
MTTGSGGCITSGSLPCAQGAKTSSALVKSTIARRSACGRLGRGGHSAINFEAPMVWSLWRKKPVSASNRSTSLASTCSLTVVAVDALAPISWAATEVTNSRPRGTVPRLPRCGRSQPIQARHQRIRPMAARYGVVSRSLLDSSNIQVVAVVRRTRRPTFLRGWLTRVSTL